MGGTKFQKNKNLNDINGKKWIYVENCGLKNDWHTMSLKVKHVLKIQRKKMGQLSFEIIFINSMFWLIPQHEFELNNKFQIQHEL
jgi:hypothetical protein